MHVFDAHLHADGLTDADLDNMVFFGLAGAVTCAHDAAASGSAAAWAAHWDDLVERHVARLRARGVAAYAAVGLHPARIPWRGLEEALHRLSRLFDDPRVVALGEIGLDASGAREEQVFARQLEMARAVRRPVIVHTPERDKLRVTRRALSLLRESGVEPSRVRVDHASAQTFRIIRACGHAVGLTLHPDALDADEAARLVRRFGSEGVVLSSDAGDGPADLLALPRAASRLRELGIPADVVRRAVETNALAFYGLQRASLARTA
jgi:hypothetical protein